MSKKVDTQNGERRRNKGGRPKKEAAEKLKYKVVVFFNTGDFYALRAKAKAAKLSLAEVARRAVTGCRIVERFTPEQAAGLRSFIGMGNNLNQLTKLAHQAGYPNVEQKLHPLVAEIRHALKRFNDDGEDC